jgi:hypothetical protein
MMQHYAYEVEETGARFEALLICRQTLSAEELSLFGHEPRYDLLDFRERQE